MDPASPYYQGYEIPLPDHRRPYRPPVNESCDTLLRVDACSACFNEPRNSRAVVSLAKIDDSGMSAC
ncbi:hypothetical protein V1264_008134 [Littorina saxatilis]|uniref:Uncharacterized protein n=1 Tax=Littorina saxatilis TaxID=31220 RepID=A0AAN9ASH0_9CAEN